MAKKQWYTITLKSNIDDYSEVLAKVKSKGLANIVKNSITETYKNTNYIITIE